MVVVLENPANNSMHNSALNVGVINPPAQIYRPVLYSDKEASDSFKLVNKETTAKAVPIQKTKKTPTLIKLLYWTIGLTTAFFGGKKLYAFIKK